LAAAFAAAALTLAGWSASSRAAVYCVSGASHPGCDSFNANLQTQLSAAQINPGHDEVQIYPNTYTGNFSYQNLLNSTNTVEIRGMGDQPSQTTLKISNHTGLAKALSVSGPAGSSIANLAFVLDPDSDTSSDAALDVAGENGGNITIEGVAIDGPHSSNATGIRCGNCLIKDSAIDLTSDGMYSNSGVRQNGGPVTIESSSIVADDGFTHSSPGERSRIDHSRISAHIGASTDGGFIDISDSLIRLDDESGAIGVNFHNPNSPLSQYDLGGNLDGVTIINGVDNVSGDHSTGIVAVADSATESVTTTLTNSVISGFTDHPNGLNLDLKASGGGKADFQSDYSAYNNGDTTQVGGGPGGDLTYSLGSGHIDLEGDPGYVDPAVGDYTPGPGSDLLDGGDPADPDPGSTDIGGNQRACHGTSDGVIRRDIGAFERKVDPDDDCSYPETSIVEGPEAYPPAMYTGHTMKFELSSSKANSTFRCSIDAQVTPCTASFTTPELAYGPHTFKAAAVDQYGNVDQTPSTSNFYLTVPKGPPPGCQDIPAICPDKTAPKIIGVKAAKRTKRNRIKVRFKSNENGSTFECRLNKGKFEKCKSPWKTPKLKRGKNTIALRATDRAGNKSKVVKRTIKKLGTKRANRR